MRIWLFGCMCNLLFVVCDAIAQDTLSIPPDTLDAATVPDAAKPSVSGVDTVVVYSAADSIVYSLTTRTMTLYSKGDIKYRQMQLKAEAIDINWDTAIMAARGIPDTSDTAASAEEPNTNTETSAGKYFRSADGTKAKYRGTPVMVDGSEEYHGFELSYNFRTQKGRIDVGDTESDGGYYHGEAIKKVDRDILFVEDGRYTTCDADDPHYYFFSPKMKVVMQDKVVAEPVYLYIADVPVFVLPFGVFPNKSGRRSGIIAPAYVEDPTRGRGLLHLGYYWAINDYMGWSVQGDGFTNGSWGLASNVAYKLRYNFDGSLSGEYRRYFSGVRGDPGASVSEAYVATIRHSQEIDPTTRANVNFTFASDNSYQLTNNLDQALKQEIISNATLSKSWEGTPHSMNLNISRRQNLRDGRIDETLPSLSFNRSQTFPFRSSKKGTGSSDQAWYEMIAFSYNANAANARSKTPQRVALLDTTRGTVTLKTVEEFGRSERQDLSQNIYVNVSPKLGYFTVTPSFSFQDARSRTASRTPVANPSDSLTLVTARDEEWLTRGSFSSGISAGTRLFGIVQPNALGIGSVRHTLSPSLGLSYSKQVYGRNLGKGQMLGSLNVGNVFEMKTLPSPGDTTEGKKIQLLNVGAGLTYNFSADSLNFSEIGLNFRTDIANVVNLSGGTSFNLYKFENGHTVNKFLISEEGRLARMTSFSLSLSTSFSGEKSEKPAPQTGAQLARQAEGDTTEEIVQRPAYTGVYAEEEPDLSIPWSLNLSWNFSESKVPNARGRSSNLQAGLSFNLTEHWKFTANGSYDVINKEISAPQIEIYRDLHCWEMYFTWVPIGSYRHFRFEIRVKAPQLQDVKITKQRSSGGFYD
jgi:hypothetical protein